MLIKLIAILSRVRKLLFACVLPIFPTVLFAQDNEEFAPFIYGHDLGIALLNSETSFYFSIYDSVTDRCWLNSNRSLSLAKREFLDAGFTNIVEEYGIGASIQLSALGYETSAEQCAVYVSFEVGIIDVDRRFFKGTTWLAFSEKTSYQTGSLLTGPRSGMSPRIPDTFAGYIDQFIVFAHQEKLRLETVILEQETDEAAKAEFLNSLRR